MDGWSCNTESLHGWLTLHCIQTLMLFDFNVFQPSAQLCGLPDLHMSLSFTILSYYPFLGCCNSAITVSMCCTSKHAVCWKLHSSYSTWKICPGFAKMASWLVVQTRLEEYLTLADVLAVDMVEITEKSREKDRRQVTREEKILQQKEEHVSLISAT